MKYLFQENEHVMWYNLVICESSDSVHQPHDKGYKSLLSSKKVFHEFLCSFVTSVWVNQLKTKDLLKIDKSYISSDFQAQESDLIYQVTGSYPFFILVELQSDPDSLMPFRLNSYMLEIWRDYLKNRESAIGRSEYKLPVIVPIVIYNGSRPWTVPERYREYLLKSHEFDGLVYDFNYIIIDIHRLDEEKLMGQSNLISIVFTLDRIDDITELLDRLKILLVKVKKLPILEQTLFWDWLLRILKPRLTKEEQQLLELLIHNEYEEEDAMITNIEKAWQRSLDEKYIEGKLEGKLEGKQEGKLQIVRRMLGKGLTASEISELTGLSEEEVNRLQ
jgi:predicted transposase/invertase (TIGR01784 family)